jgi:hypothetical protein
MRDDKQRQLGRSNATIQLERRSIPWVWEGVIASEAITLLSAPEKVGKTTLLSLLLDRRRSGGELLGRTVYPGKSVVCSEENERLWSLRQPPLDFGAGLTFHRPVGDYPTRSRWRRFIDDLCGIPFEENPIDLVVIDTAVSFIPLAHRDKRVLRWALAQLSLVADFPAGVLILNQSRNVQRPLAAFADIVIDMSMPRGLGQTRRRTFTGVGRYPGTLSAVSAELNAEGTDYQPVAGSLVPRAPLLPTIQKLLAASATPLTRQELLDRWPGKQPRPDSLWRTLVRGTELGLFVARGSGTKAEAFRYAIPSLTPATEPDSGTIQPSPGATTDARL